MAAVVAVAVTGALFIIVAGPLLLRGYGRAFAEAYPVLLILIGSTIAEATAIATYQVIQTRGHIWSSFFFDLGMLLAAILLTHRYGAPALRWPPSPERRSCCCPTS